MESNFERKLIDWLRGLFAFFLICLLLAAAVTYAVNQDMPTAILFGVCGLAQMALYVGFPARSYCPYQSTNRGSIVDSERSCATDFSPDGSEPVQVKVLPSGRRTPG